MHTTEDGKKIDIEVKIGLRLNGIGNVSFARSFECLHVLVFGAFES